MITWSLWHALRTPPYDSPLFRRIANMKTSFGPLRKRLRYLPDILLTIFFIIVFALGTITLVQGFTFIAIVAALIIFGGTLYGLDWCIAISDVISREQEENTFDVLSLLPAGPFGASWDIALGQLYRDASFYRRRERFERVILMILALIGFLLIIGLLAQIETESWSQYVLGLVALTAFVLAAYLDFAQSVITGLLVGVLVTTFSKQRLDAQLWSMSLFLSAQIGSYLVAYLVGFVMLPAITSVFPVDATTLQLILSIPRLLVFFLVREALVALLWRSLLLRFNEPVIKGS